MRKKGGKKYLHVLYFGRVTNTQLEMLKVTQIIRDPL